MFSEFVSYVSSSMLDLGYLWIFFMMVLESSFIPFPSEVAMVPAWYFVSQGQMNFLVAVFAWTFLAFIWALINYFIWYFLWENVILKLIRKYWKYFLIKEEWYRKTEKYFLDNWSFATFTGRLIPVIRQLISIPAGIFKINFWKFVFFTVLWAGLWNIILMIIWYVIWKTIWNVENVASILDRPETAIYLRELTIWWIILAIILIAVYIFYKKRKKI